MSKSSLLHFSLFVLFLFFSMSMAPVARAGCLSIMGGKGLCVLNLFHPDRKQVEGPAPREALIVVTATCHRYEDLESLINQFGGCNCSEGLLNLVAHGSEYDSKLVCTNQTAGIPDKVLYQKVADAMGLSLDKIQVNTTACHGI